jgi:hypothetical protein
MEGGPLRVDLAALGYSLKGPESIVCYQCHGPEEPHGFADMHEEHVLEKGYDCLWCHTFSRPERGLLPPPVDLPGDLNCDSFIDGFDVDPFVTALTSPDDYLRAFPFCPPSNADINGDGTVDGFDIDPFVLLLTGGF